MAKHEGIKLSVKGLAKYIVSKPHQQRKILRDHKFPDPEGYAQAGYYRDARDRIAVYHSENHTNEWLLEEANRLHLLGNSLRGQVRARLVNNAGALRSYQSNYGNRKFLVLPDELFTFTHKSVRVSIKPDLHVEENGIEKLIFIDFTKDKTEPEIANIITQMLFLAQPTTKTPLPPSSILYFDASTGCTYKAKTRTRVQKDIESACVNIEAIWSSI